jgi:hypothetical protein
VEPFQDRHRRDALLEAGGAPDPEEAALPAQQRQLDVLRDRHREKGRRDLEGPRHAGAGEAVRRHAGDVAVVEPDAPAVGAELAADHGEQRRLAGAVGADHGEALAALQREADRAHGVDAAEGLDEAVRRQERHVSRASIRSRAKPTSPSRKTRTRPTMISPFTSFQ